MKKALYILIPLCIALALRLYPTLISGMPFSTDAWPLIRNTEQLIQNTPVLLNNHIFDGYNNFWPASQLFGAILSQITNLPVITAMALGIPIAAALTIPIFYLLVKKLTQNNKISLIATILIATVFPYTLFTAGVTKETFASPIYISIIVIFLLKHNWKTTLLFSVASVTLVATHHLTAFLAIGILTSISIASFISKKNKDEKVNTNKSNFLLLAILSTITVIYFLRYASPAFMVTLSSSDLLTVGAYQVFIIALIAYVVYNTKNFSRKVTFLNSAIGFIAAFLFILLLTEIPLMSTAPTLPSYYFLYALPFIIALPLVIFGLNELYQKHSSLVIPLFWIMSVVAFGSYAVFANPSGGVSFVSRSVNFMLPPLTILIAVGLYKLSGTTKHLKTHTITKFITIAVILSMVTINTYTVYATVSLQEPYLGYFWRYEPSEYKASDWMTANANNQTVAGDSKVYYLLNGYFNENVSVIDGLRFLQGNGSAPKIVYIYNQMKTNGYVLYQGIPLTLPANWTDKLISYNCVYANSEVTIYARR
jgi:hypothetical protein